MEWSEEPLVVAMAEKEPRGSPGCFLKNEEKIKNFRQIAQHFRINHIIHFSIVLKFWNKKFREITQHLQIMPNVPVFSRKNNYVHTCYGNLSR